MEEFPAVCTGRFDSRNYPPQKPKITTLKVCLGLREFQHNANLPATVRCKGRRAGAGQQDQRLWNNAHADANPSCPLLEECLWQDVVAVI